MRRRMTQNRHQGRTKQLKLHLVTPLCHLQNTPPHPLQWEAVSPRRTTGNHNAHTSEDGQSPFWQLVRKRFHSEKPLLLFKLETDLICHIFGSFDQTFLYLTNIVNTRDTKDKK